MHPLVITGIVTTSLIVVLIIIVLVIRVKQIKEAADPPTCGDAKNVQFLPVLYINLDKRVDRKNQLEEEMKGLEGLHLNRISAHSKPEFPAVGCTTSHLKAMKLAQRMNWPYVLLSATRTDCFLLCFYNSNEYYHTMLSFFPSVSSSSSSSYQRNIFESPQDIAQPEFVGPTWVATFCPFEFP